MDRAGFQSWRDNCAMIELQHLSYEPECIRVGLASNTVRSNVRGLRSARRKLDGFRSFVTARRTIAGFEAMLWLKKSFGFAGEWTVRRQNKLLAFCFGRQMVNNP